MVWKRKLTNCFDLFYFVLFCIVATCSLSIGSDLKPALTLVLCHNHGHSAGAHFVKQQNFVLLLFLFCHSYRKGSCQNVNVIVNEANPLESIAVVCFQGCSCAINWSSFPPVPLCWYQSFALLSCYRDCADIMWKSPQSESTRRRTRTRKRRTVKEWMFQAISSTVSTPTASIQQDTVVY